MNINKTTEAEIDKFLKESGIPTWHRGYRYLKDVIIYSIDHPDKPVKEYVAVCAKRYNAKPEGVYRAIVAVVKAAKVEEKPNILTNEFINMCISSLSYAALYGDE